ncbi:SPFH domain-containing protein [Petroclostridium sp. X23]|uniref:SPFH domain-containing protein n=1 Tax=Petroclostridium sp. X23 TaxID=3045146 RepID=UPI0024AD2882|nr:SPFH domain-containing protein [Petroclostridium sp. X23]WHH61333.1 SPFH domain-containing protein [Petroclostridium sp. X23]
MGLLKITLDSIKGTIGTQSLTTIRCDDMGDHILMMKKTGKNGIIRNGSVIIVNPGQMAVIVDNGKVLDASAEPGAFEFRSEASPSFFSGDYMDTFREMWTRFTFGGAGFQDQAVFFLNTKEILNNGFGTLAPVMYRDWEHCMSDARRPGHVVPIRVGIKCSGNYTFQIDQPARFLERIGGTAPIYGKEELCDQMRMEIIAVFQAVLNSLCDEGHQVFPLDLPSQGFMIKELMQEKVFDKNIRERGLRIVDFHIINVILDDESKRKIDEFERSGDFASQQAVLTNAVHAAAGNDAGAGVGFMNLNMMSQAMGGMFHRTIPSPSIVQNGNQGQQQSPGVDQTFMQQNNKNMSTGICSKCGGQVSGKFCSNCGTPYVVNKERFCSNCGTKVQGNFCSDCGTKME